MKRTIEVHYSYREYREEPFVIDCKDPDDLDEDQVIEAMRLAGKEFSEDEELQVDSWGEI